MQKRSLHGRVALLHSSLHVHLRLSHKHKQHMQIPGGGTPYNGLYGEALPERGTFFRLQVYKRVGISQV